MNFYTYTGRITFPGGAPSILDIAVGLSRECRYAGAGIHWWPVALHTFVVCDLLPTPIKIHGLLHDACECILGDIPKPAKTQETEMFEHDLTDAIYRNLDIPLLLQEESQLVHEADRRALHGEVYTVGTRALRTIYYRDPDAEGLVEHYQAKYPPLDCINPNGSCVKEFLRRFDEYRRQG
jgi:hypothetical protein